MNPDTYKPSDDWAEDAARERGETLWDLHDKLRAQLLTALETAREVADLGGPGLPIITDRAEAMMTQNDEGRLIISHWKPGRAYWSIDEIISTLDLASGSFLDQQLQKDCDAALSDDEGAIEAIREGRL